jgi:predicted O-linked N-acetylglucosamine transferase (SPINDLY family)
VRVIFIRIQEEMQTNDHGGNILQQEQNSVDAQLERATKFIAERRMAEAEGVLREALRIKPDCLEARINLGGIYLQLGKVDVAEEWYRKALHLSPNDTQSHYNLALCLRMQERMPEAIEHLEHVCLLVPGHKAAQLELAILRLNVCDWSRRARDVQAIRSFFEEGLESDELHYDRTWTLNQIDPDPDLQSHVARKAAAGIVRSMATVKEGCAFAHSLEDTGRLKIGYVSPDFRRHAVGTIIHGMFQKHDRDRFEIHAYSLRTVDDPFQNTVRHSCEFFHDVETESPEDLARRIHSDDIQILVDLGGYTTFCKPEVFALEPSPVQVQYLGFLNTMGAPFYQYTIADSIVMTDDLANHYTENIVFMPDSFMIAAGISVDDAPITRADVGLPEGAIVYASFNTPYKIDPTVFDSWARILQSAENSVLWVYANENESTEDNIRVEARLRGVNEDKIIFAKRMPPAKHLARAQLADLVLDTYVYNAGATAAGILYAGVPIISRYGSTVLSRMGASMLHAIGLEELVCQSATAYEEMAIALGNDGERLSGIRAKLRSNIGSSPLFNTANFVRHLEGGYELMWRNAQRNKHDAIRLD